MASAVPAGEAPAAESADEYSFAVEARNRWAIAGRRFLRHKLATASLVVLTLLFAAGFLANQLAPHGYLEINLNALAAGPSWSHPFGTDQLGRDYLSRTLYGLGTETRIALLVAFFGTMIGTFLGAIAGYFGGLVENLVMRVTDLMLTMPPLIVLLVAAVYLHATTVFWISLLFACVMWMPIARVVRSRCLSLREKEYVEAARAMGASDLRIIGRHILPNAVGSIAVAATVMTATAIILETTISFLGFGISNITRPDARTTSRTPSLGDVLYVAKDEGLSHWWGTVFPGLAIILIVAPIYFVGDGLRDALDPVERRYVSVRESRRAKRAPSRAFSRLLAATPRPQLHAFPRLELRARVPAVRLPFDPLRPVRPVVALVASAYAVTADALAARSRRRASRGRSAWRLLVEALVIVVLTAGAGVALYLWKVNPTGSPWRAAGTEVQNVSRAPGAQTEISVAVAPSNPNVLFAASNDTLMRTIRVHTSTDGGRTWSSSVGPSLGASPCARGDPSVAIAPDGREYVAFTVNRYCTQNDPTPYLVVAGRAGPRTDWKVRPVVTPVSTIAWDDKPAIASGRDGRIYVAWSRLLSPRAEATVVSSSADGGRSWSRPRVVDRRLVYPQLVAATVGPNGTLYLAGVDARFGMWIARSANRGRGFDLRSVARLPGSEAASCISGGLQPIAAQANRCLGPDPTITATARHVYVTYGAPVNATKDVSVAVFDPALHPLWRGHIGPGDGKKTDQFWPVSAVDPRTDQLWACFYDTSGDPSREQAWFSCTVSRDGRRWATPVRAARASANAEVLWEDSRIFGFEDMFGYGGYTGLAVADGTAHPMWIDTRDLGGGKQEIFAARIAADSFRP